MQLLRVGVDHPVPSAVDERHEDAVAALKFSGTSAKYEGLYRDVAAFEKPTAEELAKTPKTVPERVMPVGMRSTMVQVNERWDFLKSSRKQGWKVPKESPDVSPPHEARMLWELYRESNRTGGWKSYGDEFRTYLVEGEKAAIALEKALRGNDVKRAEKQYRVLKANCNSCHAQYRD